MSESTISLQVQACLDRLRQGDAGARNDLIGVASARLTALTRKMFRDYDRLRAGGLETGDVCNNAVLRLWRALEQMTPASARDFYGLAALQIRRELLDLCRGRDGRSGDKRRPPESLPSDSVSEQPQGQETYDPQHLALWTEFHEAVEKLDLRERELVDLLWYQGLTQEEASEILGVDKSTVKRRWRSVRLMLAKVLGGSLPDSE
jgi:RNA polymerase sigma-70 factor (ECF subfamily)